MNEVNELIKDGIINVEQHNAINIFEASKPISVHWEVRTILYLGLLLLTYGIGIFVYQNINTIGHQAIIAFIFLGCIACLYYGYSHRTPYGNKQTIHTSPFFDYIVLLGCILFGTFIGYLQFQYSLFGLHYGVATFILACVFFFCAYLFDHKGILSLGITGLAAWAGLSVTPLSFLEVNSFSDNRIIYSAITIAAMFAGFSKYALKRKIKAHFDFTYNNFAANILFVAALAALFNPSLILLGTIALAITCYYYINYAIALKSFWFLLLSIIYGYIGATYLLFELIIKIGGGFALMFGMLYSLASCAGIVLFFIYYKRILKINNDSL